MEPRKIIKQYMTTEKSTIIKENEAKYTFSVDIRANKRQIKEAVDELFKIEVDSVRTVSSNPSPVVPGICLRKAARSRPSLSRMEATSPKPA